MVWKHNNVPAYLIVALVLLVCASAVTPRGHVRQSSLSSDKVDAAADSSFLEIADTVQGTLKTENTARDKWIDFSTYLKRTRKRREDIPKNRPGYGQPWKLHSDPKIKSRLWHKNQHWRSPRMIGFVPFPTYKTRARPYIGDPIDVNFRSKTRLFDRPAYLANVKRDKIRRTRSDLPLAFAYIPQFRKYTSLVPQPQAFSDNPMLRAVALGLQNEHFPYAPPNPRIVKPVPSNQLVTEARHLFKDNPLLDGPKTPKYSIVKPKGSGSSASASSGGSESSDGGSGSGSGKGKSGPIDHPNMLHQPISPEDARVTPFVYVPDDNLKARLLRYHRFREISTEVANTRDNEARAREAASDLYSAASSSSRSHAPKTQVPPLQVDPKGSYLPVPHEGARLYLEKGPITASTQSIFDAAAKQQQAVVHSSFQHASAPRSSLPEFDHADLGDLSQLDEDEPQSAERVPLAMPPSMPSGSRAAFAGRMRFRSQVSESSENSQSAVGAAKPKPSGPVEVRTLSQALAAGAVRLQDPAGVIGQERLLNAQMQHKHRRPEAPVQTDPRLLKKYPPPYYAPGEHDPYLDAELKTKHELEPHRPNPKQQGTPSKAFLYSHFGLEAVHPVLNGEMNTRMRTGPIPRGSVFNMIPRWQLTYEPANEVGRTPDEYPYDPYRLVRLAANGVLNLRPQSVLPPELEKQAKGGPAPSYDSASASAASSESGSSG